MHRYCTVDLSQRNCRLCNSLVLKLQYNFIACSIKLQRYASPAPNALEKNEHITRMVVLYKNSKFLVKYKMSFENGFLHFLI